MNSLVQKILSRTDWTASGGGCWLTTWCTNGRGYAYVRDGERRKQVYVHRAIYEAFNGPVPSGMCVCHHCDNPPCVNPAHLFLGTHADNHRDRNLKGRQARGERNGFSKLTEEAVRSIRSDPRRRSTIAAEYGITRHHVGMLKRRDAWKHLA